MIPELVEDALASVAVQLCAVLGGASVWLLLLFSFVSWVISFVTIKMWRQKCVRKYIQAKSDSHPCARSKHVAAAEAAKHSVVGSTQYEQSGIYFHQGGLFLGAISIPLLQAVETSSGPVGTARFLMPTMLCSLASLVVLALLPRLKQSSIKVVFLMLVFLSACLSLAVLSFPATRFSSELSVGIFTFQFAVFFTFGLSIAQKSFSAAELIILSELLAWAIASSIEAVQSGPLTTSPRDYLISFAAILLHLVIYSHLFLRLALDQAGALLAALVELGFITVFVPVIIERTNAIQLIFVETIRAYRFLFLWWAIVIGFFVLVFYVLSTYTHSLHSKSLNTIIRKLFHALALLLFVPAIVACPEILRFSQFIALLLLIAMEYIRFSGTALLEPGDFSIAARLQRYVAAGIANFIASVTNSRDRHGPLTLSHIYLMIGCSLPLFVQYSPGISMPAIYASGLAILGVGDSMASIIGSRFGKHKWMPEISSKSIEGSVAGVISTVSALVCIEAFFGGSGVSQYFLWLVIVASTLACAVEAVTSHIDNLVLPPFFLALLMLLQVV